jgi:hypothetical protein
LFFKLKKRLLAPAFPVVENLLKFCLRLLLRSNGPSHQMMNFLPPIPSQDAKTAIPLSYVQLQMCTSNHHCRARTAFCENGVGMIEKLVRAETTT